MTTFGDLANRADMYLAAAARSIASAGGSLTSGAIAAAANEVGHIATVLSRYAIAPVNWEPEASPLVVAVAGAGAHLRFAAGLLVPTGGLRDTGFGPVDPGAGDLADAATALAAGSDLLISRVAAGHLRWPAHAHWADRIPPRMVAAALTADLARWSQFLADMAAPLNHLSRVSAAHDLANRLTTARVHVTAAAAQLDLVAHGLPDPAAYQRLLHAIPATGPPPRQPAEASQSLSLLCDAIGTTAERIRTLSITAASQSDDLPRMAVADWRWAAKAAAVATDCAELVLVSLQPRASELGAAGAAEHLREASKAMRKTKQAWLAAHETARPFIMNGHQPELSPVGDLNDLVLRIGRLAYANPAWSPALADRAPPRKPTDLAPDVHTLAAAVSVVHDAADALACLAAAGVATFDAASARRELFIPASPVLRRRDPRFRFLPARNREAAQLRSAFSAAGRRSARVSAALDDAAVILDAPSSIFAIARSLGHRWYDMPAKPSARRRTGPSGDARAWRLAFPHPPAAIAASATDQAAAGPRPYLTRTLRRDAAAGHSR